VSSLRPIRWIDSILDISDERVEVVIDGPWHLVEKEPDQSVVIVDVVVRRLFGFECAKVAVVRGDIVLDTVGEIRGILVRLTPE